MTKVQQLSGVLIALVLVSVALFVFDGKGGGSDNIDRTRFLVEDTAAIQSVTINSKAFDLKVEKQEGSWVLNDSLAVDPSVMRVMKSILSQVNVQRPISQLNVEEIRELLRNTGQQVTLELNGEEKTFFAGGNVNKTQAYFADADLENIYLVNIPGYNHYLSGIFELTPNQWRDRELFDSNYRSIQNLTIDYADGSQLVLEFEDRFFAVNQLQRIDTAVLMDYLNGFEGFLLNDYLSPGMFPSYDSLLQTEPIAKLNLTDIDASKNRALEIYAKIPGEQFYLLSDGKQEMMVVDERRTEMLLKREDDFKLDDSKEED
ncbi:DUF4340 domain-containing protein [Reichenbachiella ulvae]|uniref:DUF4340 domain-containing protein n=1 Tax=Reichenbachiella ulvae TaxID=2980104 RepID=A0ABT3CPA9_9BACT|nr:DUF4340 domain-containing protein [Reichenbachiella ulvae]MCV9385373.1 DUF4340 domain-containing protein [Reichenbachiella ulvae]